MSTTTTSPKPRQPRLRASCDGCFLAKVKCSKLRPVCARCLATGIDCRYSPSSRAGKPKSDHNSKPAKQHHSMDMTVLAPGLNFSEVMYSAMPVPPPHLYPLETGWGDSPTSMDGIGSRNSSVSSSLAMMGLDSPNSQHMGNPNDMFGGANMFWSPSMDPPVASFSDMMGTTSSSAMHMNMNHDRSQSIDDTVVTPDFAASWVDPLSQFHFPPQTIQTPIPIPAPTPTQTPALTPVRPTEMPADYFSSPSTTPISQPALPHNHPHFMSSPTGSHSSCSCFQSCLQSLRALHDVPAFPPLDTVLRLNSGAIESCSAMLACHSCMGRADKESLAMLLVTVFTKITACYKEASHDISARMNTETDSLLSHSWGIGTVMVGEYTLQAQDSHWLEVQIWEHELDKLRELYKQFTDATNIFPPGAHEVGKAMVAHVGKSLDNVLEIIGNRKGKGVQQ